MSHRPVVLLSASFALVVTAMIAMLLEDRYPSVLVQPWTRIGCAGLVFAGFKLLSAWGRAREQERQAAIRARTDQWRAEQQQA